jgi:hypothetical protein
VWRGACEALDAGVPLQMKAGRMRAARRTGSKSDAKFFVYPGDFAQAKFAPNFAVAPRRGMVGHAPGLRRRGRAAPPATPRKTHNYKAFLSP